MKPSNPRSSPRLFLAAVSVLAAVAAVPFGCTTGNTARTGALAAADVGKFVWHDLTTDDVAACKKFYAALLGWEYVDTTVLGRPYSVARLGKTPIGGIHAPRPDSPGKTAAHWLSYMAVDDVDGSVAKAKAAGAGVLAGPIDIDAHGRAAVLRDPQGAPFGLVHLASGIPPDTPKPVEGTFFWNEYLTHDLDATLAFYDGLVPFELNVSKSESGASYALLKHGNARAGVFRLPEAKQDVPPNWLPYVFVTDPAALSARVPGLGGRVLLAPHPDIRKGSFAVVADPTGGVVALQKYPF
ncbi:MAG TPA: VOC family protein [Thermoanaerobaculia bacterium]|nr:VOC family protein [Thermoanaerobaculia bacterium]